ncbi:GNAT family N-acetyltransferase [Actinotalea sp. M2MS4P-6]|uniref:GNAT family N-acetyltransferase n=1 Tax=Actinotalea sp. M2MS4P-6 TaxID=2983762 RepID=UPI0021E45304|nr:GNAT family N-acetyltransferase [Actinotalea sp. M2MS4P-6]MCV2393988.1 GNAT family N-acetyltransferase [Actinotalea sp. M2MS4P-6]
MQDELPEVTIRPAVVDDADAIAQVHVASWRQAYAGHVPQAQLDGLDTGSWSRSWRDRIAGRHGTILVAEDDGDVIGFVSYGASRDEDASPGTIEIYAIYLEPHAWGHGAAREMMRTLLGSLPDSGTVTLWALASNERARHFYRRHGFTPDGVERMEEIGGASVLEVRYRRG